MEQKELLTKNIKRETMKAAWFPPDWHEIVATRAKEEGLPFYKYVMMLSNNHAIIKTEKRRISD